MAGTLNPLKYDVSIATGTDFQSSVTDAGFAVHNLWCIGSAAYLSAVTDGRVVFSYEVLERYVLEDLHLIDTVKPDIIVGDFRLSLAVSARLKKIPYVGISNAYWSPYAYTNYEIPTHPATRVLGLTAANHIFQLLRPLIFAYHSLPMYRLFQKYGMASLGFDLRRIFTEADVSVFADVPEMVATKESAIPNRYVYIGPVIWSPRISVPPELTNQTELRPLVYITMGSSGDSNLLNEIVRAILSLGCRVAVATFGGILETSLLDHVVTSNLLPGSEIAAKAKLVICNGGSPSTHQALQQGTPVLGIPANMDQLLNMSFLVAAGAGLKVRADEVTYDHIRSAAQRILKEPEFSKNAKKIANWFMDYVPSVRFPAVIDMINSQSNCARREGGAG